MVFDWDSTIEFEITEDLSLKLEKGKTNIYVNNEKFRSCKYLLMNVNLDEVEKYDRFDSIDEAVENLDNSLEGRDEGVIKPEVEFWGHCSNLQAWAENGYDTRLLEKKLAFPLLKELSKYDDRAEQRFSEELVRRINKGCKSVRDYLFKDYWKYFKRMNVEKLDCINVKKLSLNNLRKFSSYYGRASRELRTRLLNTLVNESGFKKMLTINKYEDYFNKIPHEELEDLGVDKLDLSNEKPESMRFLGIGFQKFRNSNFGKSLYDKCYLSNLPDYVKNFKDLEVLDLTNNFLNSLPQDINKLNNLRELYVNDNEISYLPEAIGELNKLEVLSLSHNNLFSLPESICDLENLKVLDSDYNHIHYLPDSMGCLENLERMNFSVNSLQELPASFINLENLKVLNLTFNQITSVPKKVNEIQGLQILI